MNSMYFTKEDIEAGLMTEFVSLLCRYSYQSGPRDLAQYNDIHIKPADCEAFVVEWEQAPWSHEFGGRFEYVGEEQVVCNEVVFPDKHYEYTTEDPDEAIKEWLEDNPGWEKDNYGYWHKNIAEKPKDKLSQWLDENAGWHDSENGWTKE